MNGGRKENNLDTKKRKEVQTLFERSVCLSVCGARTNIIPRAKRWEGLELKTQKMEKNDEKDFIFRRVEKGREDTAWIYVSWLRKMDVY